MNKVDYCYDKVEELERRLMGVSAGIDNHRVSEFSMSFADGFFTGERVFESPLFSGKVGKSLVFQIKLDLEILVEDSIEVFVGYSGFQIYFDKMDLMPGRQSLFFMKSVDCVSDQPLSLELKVRSVGGFTQKIYRVDYFVWGGSHTDDKSAILSASTLRDQFALAMVFDGQLYLANYEELPSEILASDLVYRIPAKDVSVCFVEEDGQSRLHIFRVDGLNNLNHSRLEYAFNEELLDTSVSAVTSARVYDSEKMLVAYIKSCKAFARLFDRGGFSDEIVLPVPASAVCERVSIVNNTKTAVLVIVTTDTGANYLCISNNEAGISENIKLKTVFRAY